MTLSDIKYLIIQSFKEWQADKASRLAAALAYYTVFSIPPLLIIALAIAGQLFGQQAARDELLLQSKGLVGETGAEAIQQILENASQPEAGSLAAIISLAVLLLGASGVFLQLQDAMNTIWNVEADPGRGIVGTLKDRFLSFSMVVGVGFLLLVSLIVSSTLSALNNAIQDSALQVLIVGPIPQAVNFLFSFAIITLLFAMIFKVIPDVEIKWRDVWVGATVTALLFVIGEWGLSYYLGSAAPESTYGAAGSLIVLLLWVYYSAQILFLGAEFTQVYAHKFGSYNPVTAASPSAPTYHGPQGIASEESATGLIAHQPKPVKITALTPQVETFNRYAILALAVPVAVWQFVRRQPRQQPQ